MRCSSTRTASPSVNQCALTPDHRLIPRTFFDAECTIPAEDLIFASIDDGLISVCGRDVEGTSNYRTLEELHAALDSETFWRPHRSYLVNIHHIKEVVPWFKSSYMLKMDDKKQSEVPVSRVQTKRLRELFKL